MNTLDAYFKIFLRIALLSQLFNACVYAAPISIAIVDFELNDLTYKLAPNAVNPEEMARTASLKPLLEKAMVELGDYRIAAIDAKSEALANAGFGYLFDHPDIAAGLGRKVGADWIITGRNHKASFLFVYFKAHLINTRTQRWVADYSVEIKGQQHKITPKGVRRLARQIDQTIRQQTAGNSDPEHQ